MKYSNAVDVHGQHPGLFWEEQLSHLSAEIQEKVISILKDSKEKLYTTRDTSALTKHIPDYATGTEDEANNKDVKQEVSMEEENTDPNGSNLPEDDTQDGVLI
jgi:hypothetical protein